MEIFTCHFISCVLFKLFLTMCLLLNLKKMKKWLGGGGGGGGGGKYNGFD